LAARQISAGEPLFDWAWSDSIGWVRFKYDDANAHYKLVDGNNSTYILNNTGSWQYDAYRVTDPPTGATGNITSLNIRAKFKGDIDLGVRLNGAVPPETDIGANIYTNTGGGWSWANNGGGQSFISLRPGGGSWSWNDIENMQVVVGLKKDGSVQGQTYQVEVVVNGTTFQMNDTGDYTNIPATYPSSTPASRVGYMVEANRATGFLSGYAWSENIGWISFEPDSVLGCDSLPGGTSNFTARGNCKAYIDFVTKKVYGWARACSVFSSGCSGALKSNLGGWDGWIRFNGALYSSELNDTPPTSEFFGWAWGDKKVIGWLSLNKSNTGSPIDYKVKTNLKLNTPPVADFTVEYPLGTVISPCTPASPCSVYLSDALRFINHSYDPDGNTQLTSSQWSFNWNSTGWVADVSCSAAPGAGPALCDTTKSSPVGDFQVRLRVGDEKGAFDEMTMGNIRIKQDIVARMQCSLDNSTWESNCSNINAVEGDTVYLRDNSIPSEGATVAGWQWRINGVDSGNSSQIEADAQIPIMTIELTATDTNGRQDTASQQIFGIMPLPTWREITPF
jgi:hypothetical protein